MDHEGLVLVLAHDLFEKPIAGRAFLFEHARHAEAGIDQQAECQRQIRLAREVFDGLWTAIVIQREVLFGEVLNDLAVLIVNSGEYVHHLDVG